MAVVTVSPGNDFLNFLNSNRTTEDVLLVRPGVQQDFCYPRNTTIPLTIMSAIPEQPFVMRACSIGPARDKGNFAHLVGRPAATRVENVTFDWVRFEAERFTQARNQAGQMRSLVMPDGDGIGWRVCGTSHPAGNLVGYSENGGYTGLKITSAGRNIKLRNSVVNGYSIGISCDGDDILLSHVRFEENCEDVVKGGGFDNLTVEWIECVNFRGPTTEIAQVLGWGRDEPPHADWFQQMSPGHDLTIRNFFIRDTTYRLHGGLIRNAAASGQSTGTITLENGELQTSHPSGFLIDDISGRLIVRRMKITGVGPLQGGGPVLEVNPSSVTGPVEYHDNMSTRLYPTAGNAPGSWEYSDNTRNNNPDVYPDGFVQVRKSKVAPGARYAGPGGDPNYVSPVDGVGPPPEPDPEPEPEPDPDPPTKPDALESGDVVFLELVAEPSIEAANPDDVRRTFTVYVPAGSPAFGYELRWQVLGDEPETFARAMTYLGATGPSGADVWRASSGVTDFSPAAFVPQARYPGETFAQPAFFYQVDGVRSEVPNFRLADITVPELMPETPAAVANGDVVFVEIVADPALTTLDPNDPRRTFTVYVLTTSVAFGKPLRWTTVGDPDTHPMISLGLTGPGGAEVFRATSNAILGTDTVIPHLRYPSESFDDPVFYYTVEGLHSEPSTALADIVVPVPEIPDPEDPATFTPARVIDLDFAWDSVWYVDDEGAVHGPALSLWLNSGRVWAAAGEDPAPDPYLVTFIDAESTNIAGGAYPTANIDGDTFIRIGLDSGSQTPPSPPANDLASPTDTADVDPTGAGTLVAGRITSMVSPGDGSGLWDGVSQSTISALYRGVDAAAPFLSVKWQTGTGWPITWPATTHASAAQVELAVRTSGAVVPAAPDGFVERTVGTRRGLFGSTAPLDSFAGVSLPDPEDATDPGEWITVAFVPRSA